MMPRATRCAPLGGHQSDWSRTRPVVTAEALLDAMHKSGVAKAAVVQASTLLRP